MFRNSDQLIRLQCGMQLLELISYFAQLESLLYNIKFSIKFPLILECISAYQTLRQRTYLTIIVCITVESIVEHMKHRGYLCCWIYLKRNGEISLVRNIETDMIPNCVAFFFLYYGAKLDFPFEIFQMITLFDLNSLGNSEILSNWCDVMLTEEQTLGKKYIFYVWWMVHKKHSEFSHFRHMQLIFSQRSQDTF